MKKIQTKPISGFGLIELIMVIVVAAILLALAVPNYKTFVANETASSLAAELSATFRLARNEALRRTTDIQICAMTSATDNTCNPDATNWEFGWTISVKSDNTIIQIYTPSGAQAVIGPRVTFSSVGLLQPIDTYAFIIKPAGCSRGYILVTNPGGQLETYQTSWVCP